MKHINTNITIMLRHFCFEAVWKSESGDFQLESLHVLRINLVGKEEEKKKSCNVFSDLKSQKSSLHLFAALNSQNYVVFLKPKILDFHLVNRNQEVIVSTALDFMFT